MSLPRRAAWSRLVRSRFVAFAALAAAATGIPGRALAQSAAPAADGPTLQRMTLEQCVAAALARNPDVLQSVDEVSAAESERASVAGQFGPKLHVDAYYQRWNEAYVFGGFPVHDASVWNVTASATQPLTQLFAIYDAYKVKDLGVDIAAVRREATRREAALRVSESYYRLLQAERLGEVALASVDQLAAQLRQAESFHANGIVSRDDVLRAQLASQGAQQRLIQARARVTVERGRLAALMGMRPDSMIDAQPIAADAVAGRPALSLEDAERAAEVQRVELREVDRKIEATSRDTRLAYLRLAPQVSAVGAYIHNEGSLFSQLNAGYVGAVASWDVWDWGTTTSGISEAKTRAHQAVLARSKLDDEIRLQVRQAFVGVAAASEGMEVAKASVAAAEENFRLVQRRYAASAATSFDVVDAEGLLTQARGQVQSALYDYLIARSALRGAMGVAPEALTRE